MALYSDVNRYDDVPDDIVYDVRAITQHLDNLLCIKERELLFNEDVYLSIEPWLFEPIDDDTSSMLFKILVDGVRQFDDRLDVRVDKSQVIPFPNERKFEVRVVFNVKGLSVEYEYSAELLSRFGG